MPCDHKFYDCTSANYQRCRECGTFRSKAPASPDVFYDDHYWSGVHSGFYEQAWNVDMHMERGVSKNRFVLDRIEARRAEAIDIGCSPGRLLYWLRWAARFETVTGIDPGSQKDIRAVGCHDGPLLTGLFPEVAFHFADDSASYISGLDVFEHLWEPEQFLKECYRILKPAGQLFLMMPFGDELLPESRFFAPAEHVYLHSRRHMRTIITDAGFDRINFDKWALGHDTVSARKPGD